MESKSNKRYKNISKIKMNWIGLNPKIYFILQQIRLIIRMNYLIRNKKKIKC